MDERSEAGINLFHRLNGAFQCDSDNDYGLVAEEIVEEFEMLRKENSNLATKLEFLSKRIARNCEEQSFVRDNNFKAHTALENSMNTLSHSHEVFVADTNLALAKHERGMDALTQRYERLTKFLNDHMNAGPASHPEG